jgi:hypothetical protein
MEKTHSVYLLIGALALGAVSSANAALVRLGEGSFTPEASVISFSEQPLNTTNPTYSQAGVDITFGGYFTGGLGTPTQGTALTLDGTSPDTFITSDSSNPSSPVLSGTPVFNGPVAVHFSEDVFAVGLDGGYFDAIGGTTIAAYDRVGDLIGTVTNDSLGIEFFGLGDDSGEARIAGIQFYITGNEPAGYAIDNLTFALSETEYTPSPVPLPAAAWLFGSGMLGLLGVSRRKKKA